MWVDCNCGRRNTPDDPCPFCGEGFYDIDIILIVIEEEAPDEG